MASVIKKKEKASKEAERSRPNKYGIVVPKGAVTSGATLESDLGVTVEWANSILTVRDVPVYHFSSFDKIQMVKRGISKKALEELKKKAGLDYDQLASILSVGRATLLNKKGTDKFNQTLSEKILGLADIYSYGYEVFEDKGRFNEWIFRPNRSLGGQMPYDLLDNQYGREEVKNVIGRIDFGVYS